MYQLFVAASDRVTVAQLASILHVDVDTLEVIYGYIYLLSLNRTMLSILLLR